MVTTRLATPADAAEIAALHMETLPGDVSDFTPLGAGVVRRFYRQAVERGAAVVCLAEESGVALGFVMITPDISQLFGRALLAGAGDIVAFVFGANPFGLARAVIAKFTSGTATVAAVPELVYLGVSARARGKGVGALLMDAAHAAFLGQRVESYELNVHAANAHAVKLYEGKGLTIVRRYEKGGHAMYNMRKRFSDAAQPESAPPGA
ncbi:MAG: GNAT family N-acetyltransferase [Candidatus Eisenbacteria bacterium]